MSLRVADLCVKVGGCYLWNVWQFVLSNECRDVFDGIKVARSGAIKAGEIASK
jgi:hypothetical protein